MAKSTAFWHVANYPEAYGLYARTGTPFNHESPIGPLRFVTRKIVATACRISQGSNEKFSLGNLGIRRDWGRAPEYAEAMSKTLQCEVPEDFVIATGTSHSLKNFVRQVFAELDLDWREHNVVSDALFRPTDISDGNGNADKVERLWGWKAQAHMEEVISMMMQASWPARRRIEVKADAQT